MAGKKAKPTYMNAIIGISLVLFLLGTLGWLVLNGRSLSKAFREEIQVEVILHDNTREENLRKLESIFRNQPFVKSTEMITKEMAAKRFMAGGGEDYTQVLDFNPLYPSILLNLHQEYVNTDSLEKIRRFAMQSNIVRDFTYPNAVVDKLNANLQKIGIILAGISLLLSIVVVILIDNTVRLAMFSNRFLIKTMQMVGATRWFISRPFDQRAIINGFLSGLLAVGGLYLLISFAESLFPPIKILHDPASLGLLMASMILLGVLISLLSTHRSVIKYLKMHLDDLY